MSRSPGNTDLDADASLTLVEVQVPTLSRLARGRYAAESGIASVDLSPRPFVEDGFSARYETHEVLGQGGMGEVHLCRDHRVGREVAMKVVRKDSLELEEVRARFEREARVQGQLEHPAIVPVYDIGLGDDGSAYFTMKRIRGRTFEDIIEDLRVGDGATLSSFTQRRLLVAFSRVCLALAFAHARGVIHRDLKPANVMIGDFGEVYVLDWGLAKLKGEHEEVRLIDDDDITIQRPAWETIVGRLLGTPGFMAPEQIKSDVEIDERIDVYALGATLFELLSLMPLHPFTAQTKPRDLLGATLKGADARFSTRCPGRDIAPELEAICVKATKSDRDERFGSVKEMADAIEAFLDGDRDMSRRKTLAGEAAARAFAAAQGAGVDHARRSEAIREVNHALALDPAHKGALATMVRLLLEAPKETPPEALTALEVSRAKQRAYSARTGSFSFLTTLLVVPLVFWLGIRSFPAAAFTVAAIAAAVVATWWTSRNRVGWVLPGLVSLGFSSIAICAASLLFGPFIIVPGMAAINTLSFAVVVDRGVQRSWATLAGIATVVTPLLLELVGVLPRSIDFREGTIAILPRMTHFPPTPTIVLLLLSSLVLVLIPVWAVSRLFDRVQEAERKTFVHLWHLRQLLPDEAKAQVG